MTTGSTTASHVTGSHVTASHLAGTSTADDELPPQRCSIARSLQVLGEKWTLLVVRDALRGKTRFSEFRDSLHLSTDILSDRLGTLVEIGVLERRSYREQGSRERFSYHLTESGQELSIVLAALTAWGDKHRTSGFGPATIFRDEDSHEPVSLVFADESGRILGLDHIETVSGPGATTPSLPNPIVPKR